MSVLQVSVLGADGEAVIQVYDDHCILTVRQPQAERLAEVRLSAEQAGALADALYRVPAPELEP